ncbi:MAG: hypothetical protein WBU20_02735 [Candidatus Acidiferrum sp.]
MTTVTEFMVAQTFAFYMKEMHELFEEANRADQFLFARDRNHFVAALGTLLETSLVDTSTYY